MPHKWLNWRIEMAENRTPRDLVTREKSARYVYTPPSNLPEPTPEPGMVFHWVATAILGQSDPTNVSKKLREGWVPVKATDHPEMQMMGNAQTGNIEIGGLMLCKMPKEHYEARKAYYENQAQNQMDSVDNHFMRNNDARMPLFAEKKSSVSRGAGFGSGSK
jgi:hypothetical protein